MFDGFGGKELLAGFLTHACRYVFDEVELPVVFQRIRYLRLDQRLFHASPGLLVFLIFKSVH